MKFIKGISVLILFIGLVLVVAGVIVIASEGDLSEVKNLFINDSQYEKVEKSGSEVLNEVVIDVTTNQVIFLKSTDETYKLEYYESADDKFTFSVIDGKLTLKSIYKFKFFRWGFKSAEVSKIKVYLPNSFDKTIKCYSTTGNVYMDGFSLNDLLIKLTTGDIDVINTNVVNDLTVNSTTGDIALTTVNATNLIGSITTGKINVTDSRFTNEITLTGSTSDFVLSNVQVKNVDLDTSTGSMRMYNCTVDEVRAHASTGSINFEIKGIKDNYRATLETSTGSINYDGTKVKGSLTNTTGSKLLNIKTSTGDITIKFIQ